MQEIKLRDLYFIEDNRHRRAFLKALREVEEEGFEVVDKAATITKVRKMEKAAASKKQQLAANTDRAATALVGSTPADFSRMNRLKLKPKVYTETNAVDMKKYKYWRDEEFNRIKEQYAPISSKTFDLSDRPKTTLYDELFGDDFDKPHEADTLSNRTQTYQDIEDFLKNKEEKSKSEKLESVKQSYLASSQKRAHIQDRLAQLEAIKNSKDKEKTTQEPKEETVSPLLDSSNPIDNDDTEPVENKITVEVVAPEEKPEPIKPKRKTTATKKRKRTKKLDADIRLYRDIKID